LGIQRNQKQGNTRKKSRGIQPNQEHVRGKGGKTTSSDGGYYIHHRRALKAGGANTSEWGKMEKDPSGKKGGLLMIVEPELRGGRPQVASNQRDKEKNRRKHREKKSSL